MRDALSLLDQVRSYAGEVISIEDLRSALGLIEARHSFTLLEKVVAGDLSAAVTLVNDLEQAGVDLKKFSEEFLFYLRDALFLKLSGDLKGLLGISVDEINRLEPLVQARPLPYWQQLFDLWQKHYSQIKVSQTPRLALEMALVELGMARDLVPVEELLGRIENSLKMVPPPAKAQDSNTLSKSVGKNVSQSHVAAAKTAAPAPEVHSPEPARSGTSIVVDSPKRSVPPQPGEPKSSALSLNHAISQPDTGGYCHKASAVAKSVVAESIPQEDSGGLFEMPPQAPAPDDFSEASFFDGDNGQQPEFSESAAAEPATKKISSRTGSSKTRTRVALPTENIEPEKIDSEKVSQKPEPQLPSSEQAQWETFLERLTSKDARLGAMLQRSRLQPAAVGNLVLEVAPHALALLDQDSVKQDILSLWAEFQGHNESLELQFKAAASANGTLGPSCNGSSSGSSRQRSLPNKEEIFNDPSVRFISDRFGGRVIEIKARK
jgi:DNA polymerase III gamma/tau subunit